MKQPSLDHQRRRCVFVHAQAYITHIKTRRSCVVFVFGTAHVLTCMCTCMHLLFECACVYVCVCLGVYMYVCMYSCMHACMNKMLPHQQQCTYNTRKHTYIHTYIKHANIQVHFTHTHTYNHSNSFQLYQKARLPPAEEIEKESAARAAFRRSCELLADSVQAGVPEQRLFTEVI